MNISNISKIFGFVASSFIFALYFAYTLHYTDTTYLKYCKIPNETFVVGDMHVLHDKCQRLFMIKTLTQRTIYALLRISGCTMQTLMFEYVKYNVWALQYHTCEIGEYFATIKVIFDTVHYDPEQSCVQLSHPLNAFNTSWSEYSTACQQTSWWKNNHTIPFLTGPQLDIKIRFPSLRYYYQQKSKLYQLHQNEMLCFLGDSQMRNNLNAIAGCNSIVAHRTKHVCETPHLKYFEVHYQQDIQKHVPKLKSCSKIILNFGQWDAGWPDHKFTSFLDYQRAIFRCIQQFPYKSKLIWMTTNPHPLYKISKECPPTDWRFPNVITLYNNISSSIFMENNIQIWDTFSILKHVYDFSFDGSHFSDEISYPIMQALINVL